MFAIFPKLRAARRRRLRILEETRRLLARPYGWGKYRYRATTPNAPYPTYCLKGALQAARDFTGESYAMGLATQGLLHYYINPSSDDPFLLSSYNDRKSTHKKDVLNLIDRAIEGLR